METYYFPVLDGVTKYSFGPNVVLGDYRLWGNQCPHAQAYSVIMKHEEEWKRNEPNPLKSALQRYSQELSISEAKIRTNCDSIEAVKQDFKMQVEEICKQLVQESHVVRLLGDESQEEEHGMENKEELPFTMLAEKLGISALDKYIGLDACVDTTKLAQEVKPHVLHGTLMPEEVERGAYHLQFDPGGTESIIILLLQVPLHKLWDPGGSLSTLSISWPLCYKQWDPGGSFSMSFS